LKKVTVCDSALTSVTAALMSMAMASIPKVFFMRTKQGEGYDAKQSEKKWQKRKISGSRAG